MGIGRKTKRGMNRLIKVLKRNRNLKQAARKTFVKPEEAENNNAPATAKKEKAADKNIEQENNTATAEKANQEVSEQENSAQENTEEGQE